MIIVTIGTTTEDEPIGPFIVALHEKFIARWPDHEFSITALGGVPTSVESDGADDPAHPDPDPDDVYRFVMDAWVDHVLGPRPEPDDE